MSEQTLLPTGTASTSAPAPTQHRLALVTIVTCQLMLILDATVMNVALPRISADLGFSRTGLAWVMNSYTLAFGGLLLLGGRVGDMLGRRRLFIAGIALFTVASLAGGLATSAAWLLTARIVQGVGAAAAGPNTIALIVSTFTGARERVRALALLSGTASAGFAIGLIVGGLLTELASWRWVLFINVPFGIAALLLAPRVIREPQRHPARLDLPGALTASLGVASLVYAFITAAVDGWSDLRALVALCAGVVLLVGFAAIEARTRQPLLPLRLFADRNRAAGLLTCLLGPAAMMSTFFFLTQFLQDVRGFSALATGFAFLPLAIGMFAMTRLVPPLLPRLGPRPFLLTGAVLMVAGLSWLTQLRTGSGYLGDLFGPMALLGLGGGLCFVPLTPVIMATVPAQDAGAASGALQTMQQTGAALGLSVLVLVYGSAARTALRSTGGADVAHRAVVHGMDSAFVASALIATVILVVALVFGRPRTARI